MSDAFPHRAIASRGGVRWTEEVPEGVGLAEDSQTEDSPDSQPDGSVSHQPRVLTPSREEWPRALGREPDSPCGADTK